MRFPPSINSCSAACVPPLCAPPLLHLVAQCFPSELIYLFFFFFSLAFLNHFQQGNGKKPPPFLLSFPAPGGLKSRKLEEEDPTNKSSLSRSVDELPDELSLAIARGKDWQKALPSAAGKPHFLWSRLSSGACSGCAVTNCGPQSRTPLRPRRLWPLHQRGTYIQSAPQSRNQGTAGN